MDPAIAPFAELLGVDDRLLGKALDAVKPEDLAMRPGPRSNPLVWLIGHVVVSRNLLARTAGAPGLELAWADHVGKVGYVMKWLGYPGIVDG